MRYSEQWAAFLAGVEGRRKEGSGGGTGGRRRAENSVDATSEIMEFHPCTSHPLLGAVKGPAPDDGLRNITRTRGVSRSDVDSLTAIRMPP